MNTEELNAIKERANYAEDSNDFTDSANFITHDVPLLFAEIERLRLGLEAVQSQLVYTRGDSPSEDSNITGMCIRIRQLLNGEEVDW